EEAAGESKHPASEAVEEEEEDQGKPAGEPPMDWFEPLEDDDDDPDEESLAGETESIAGSERATRHLYQIYGYRRKRAHPEEGWVEWPVLGQGWKRKEVVRRSGSSIGQKDVYYLSPRGDRVRSRVELATVLQGTDLTQFEYKSGKFVEGEIPPVRGRPRTKEKQSEEKIRLPFPSSSRPLSLPSIKGEFGSEESTLYFEIPGPPPASLRLTLSVFMPVTTASSLLASTLLRLSDIKQTQKKTPFRLSVDSLWTVRGMSQRHRLRSVCKLQAWTAKPRSQKTPVSKTQVHMSDTQGELTEASKTLLTLENVQNDVTESQHPSLKSSDTENFSANVDLDDDDMSTDDDDDWHKKRKRRSCGECKACLCRKDCGVCDFCIDKPKFGGSNKKRQKCRLRQCQRQAMRHLLPFQMAGAELGLDAPLLPGRPRPHYTYSRKSSLKRSQDQQADMDYRQQSATGELNKLNYCFSNYNQIVIVFPSVTTSTPNNNLTIDNMSDGVLKNFSELTSITALHSGGCRQRKERQQDKDHHSQWDTEKSHTGRNAPKHMGDDEDEFPMITQIFSLAENPAESGVDLENQLMKLLHSLRSSVLPILWYAIMVEGPQLQLIQCSKQSNMADTMVLIDPGFCYQVTVQKQPLLPIHPLYDIHPSRLGTATDVVSLLLSLERYVVCQGLPIKQSSFDKGPIVLERSATCDFLIKKNEQTCASCKALQELQIHHRE
uniref:Methyl-CpG binding domain protein 1b n=1 Tax=Poecilia formosa TaxID=48698 RepID=A0A096LSP3_POEFO